MTSPRLLFAGYASTLPFLLLLLVSFSVNCHAEKYQRPNIHSCGDDIRNIRFPFRLKADPSDTCGDKNFELSCENNRTVLDLGRGKFYVQAINYEERKIRLVDVGIQRNNCSALHLHDYSEFQPSRYVGSRYERVGNVSAVFLSCENPVNSPRYIDRTPSVCKNASLSSSSTKRGYSYVLVVENATLSDVSDSCSVDMMAWMMDMPISMRNEGNVSLLDVLNELADGFELLWSFTIDLSCRLQAKCFDDARNLTATCTQYFPFRYIIALYTRVVVPVLVIIFIVMIFALRILCMPCVFGFLIYKFRRRHLSMFDSIEGFLRSQNHLMPISYSYSDIKRMTKGFRDKLGEGGYGFVYKGKLRSGRPVAVKVLGKSKANGQEFINEVMTIGRIHHTNVVRLVGYCAESSKRALVYDFMPNGSLEKYIFSHEGYVSLSCQQMYEISLGVARGIEYLHRGCEMQILHFDIKPHNILLDNDFTPKVSDFGLAKLYPTDDSIVCLTGARGTMGYMAPELFYKNIGGISYKADVYSFGMLLMEMAGRRRNLNAFADHTSQIYFPSWIYDQLKEGRDVELGEATEEESVMVKKMIIVALWCIQLKPIDRPSMNKVVEMLEGNFENLSMPPKPFLCPQETPSQDQ